jgi:hypothetical protein
MGGGGGWEGDGTAVVFAVVADHEHDFPLEDIVAHEPARDPREVFGVLHVFQLSAQEAAGACGRLRWCWSAIAHVEVEWTARSVRIRDASYTRSSVGVAGTW